MLKILPMYAAAFAGAVVNHYTTNWIIVVEAAAPPMLACVVVTGLMFVTMTTLIVIAGIATKTFNLYLLRSSYRNIGIGFLYSLCYLKVALWASRNVAFLDSSWFVFLALPILIFLPLIVADYLLSCHSSLE